MVVALPAAICTIATETAMKDLQNWVYSLMTWTKSESRPVVYILGDVAVYKKFKTYSGVQVFTGLEKYKGNRAVMQSRPATDASLTGRTLWDQFQLEKATIMKHAFLSGASDVLFTDCDIMFTAPLEPLDKSHEIILSPHYIKKADTDKYGFYNGGWIWMSKPDLLEIWKLATLSSRFCEQAALEDVYTAAINPGTVGFSQNCSWWRLFQSDTDYTEMLKLFGISEDRQFITFNGEIVRTIHTHFYEFNDRAIVFFNNLILRYSEVLNDGILSNLLKILAYSVVNAKQVS